MNMLATIVPKSDQINADDLIGKTMTITITEVKFSGGQEQPVSMYFDGSDKAYRPCKSMCRVLVAAWGPDAKTYVGRSMTLYRDPTVKWGGMEVGGIRISHMTHIDSQITMALTATKGSRKPYTVKPLTAPATTVTSPQPITVEQAELDMRAAPDLDALKACWMRKVMAPHREALADVLEELKAAFSFTDEVPATTTDETGASALIAAIADEKTSDALDSFMARKRGEIDALPEETQEAVRAAYYARHGVLSS